MTVRIGWRLGKGHTVNPIRPSGDVDWLAQYVLPSPP